MRCSTVRNLLQMIVSIESGLEGRNNGVPRRRGGTHHRVSIESGLEGRNNRSSVPRLRTRRIRLNRVRPRRPEQCRNRTRRMGHRRRLNRVRPRRPEQCCKLGSVPSNADGLNRVRPRRPEQSAQTPQAASGPGLVSIESGLEGRNNP